MNRTSLETVLQNHDLEPVGDLGAHVVVTFPTGSSADMLIKLVPDQAGDPGLIDVTATMTDAGFAFQFSYFVPYAAMPPDVEQTIRAAAPSSPVAGVIARLALAAAPMTASTWTNSGTFPDPAGEEDRWISLALNDDGSVGIEAWIAAPMHGHWVTHDGFADSVSASCDERVEDYGQVVFGVLSCGDIDGSGDPMSITGTLSGDGSSADFTCTNTVTVNDTGTQTTTWDVTGTLTIGP